MRQDEEGTLIPALAPLGGGHREEHVMPRGVVGILVVVVLALLVIFLVTRL